MEILKRNTFIKKIKLPQFKKSICVCFDNSPNTDISGNADANLIGHVMKQNNYITDIDIS